MFLKILSNHRWKINKTNLMILKCLSICFKKNALLLSNEKKKSNDYKMFKHFFIKVKMCI